MLRRLLLLVALMLLVNGAAEAHAQSAAVSVRIVVAPQSRLGFEESPDVDASERSGRMPAGSRTGGRIYDVAGPQPGREGAARSATSTPPLEPTHSRIDREGRGRERAGVCSAAPARATSWRQGAAQVYMTHAAASEAVGGDAAGSSAIVMCTLVAP